MIGEGWRDVGSPGDGETVSGCGSEPRAMARGGAAQAQALQGGALR